MMSMTVLAVRVRSTVRAILCHSHLSIAENTAVPEVAAANFLHDFAGRRAAVEHDFQHFHQFRVERLADGWDRFQTVLGHRPFHALQRHRVARRRRRQSLSQLLHAFHGRVNSLFPGL